MLPVTRTFLSPPAGWTKCALERDTRLKNGHLGIALALPACFMPRWLSRQGDISILAGRQSKMAGLLLRCCRCFSILVVGKEMLAETTLIQLSKNDSYGHNC